MPKPTFVTFEHNGMNIHNPFVSECGRFEASPEFYGFAVVGTGGGCEAWRKDLEDGQYILLTDGDGCNLPDGEDIAGGDVQIGKYSNDGETWEINSLADATAAAERGEL